MVLKKVYYKIPSAGAVSWNSVDDFRGNLEGIAINPSSSTTTYDFSMTDDTGTKVYEKLGNMGTFIDDSKIGLYGIYTFAIANASVNTNSFTITIIWDENMR